MATRQDENKDAKTAALFIMTIVTLLMWLPCAAYTVLIFQSNSKEFLSRQEFVRLSFSLKILFLMNSPVNPTIFTNSRAQESSPGVI